MRFGLYPRDSRIIRESRRRWESVRGVGWEGLQREGVGSKGAGHCLPQKTLFKCDSNDCFKVSVVHLRQVSVLQGVKLQLND